MATRLPDGEKPVSSAPVDFVPARGRADKYRAIIRAARTVFGREGYPRTTIDAIAAEAGVSSRTIYNHFEGKEQLFSAVLYASAAQVAEGFSAKVATIGGSRPVTDPADDLNVLGHAFAALRLDFPEHFAMVEQIIAEAQHFPPEMIDAWQDAGPRRVQQEIARHLQQLTRDGLLNVSSPPRAAIHFMALTTAGMTTGRYGSTPFTGEQLTENVQAGVDAFLNGYGTGTRPG